MSHKAREERNQTNKRSTSKTLMQITSCNAVELLTLSSQNPVKKNNKKVRTVNQSTKEVMRHDLFEHLE